MIRDLRLFDFKCFPRLELSFGRLNVLAGSNGTGKSTVIQALLLLYQSVRTSRTPLDRLVLNGPLVEFGTGRDVLYQRSESDFFSIRFGDGTRTWTIAARAPLPLDQHSFAASMEPPAGDADFFSNEIYYLSADRLGPQRSYPSNPDSWAFNRIGKRGEFGPLLYAQSRTQLVGNPHLLLESPEKKTYADIDTQFRLWMTRLFPGFQLRTESVTQLDAVLLGLSLHKQYGESEFLRPTNVGFGVSVAFPIILAGLMASEGETVFVENPEAHLHPSAQSLIGEFLARVAAGGPQVFVETHSDHVVNGVRIAHKNGVLPTDEVNFLAFSRTDEYDSHTAIAVPIDANSEFGARPGYFFDQFDRDLRIIYDLE